MFYGATCVAMHEGVDVHRSGGQVVRAWCDGARTHTLTLTHDMQIDQNIYAVAARGALSSQGHTGGMGDTPSASDLTLHQHIIRMCARAYKSQINCVHPLRQPGMADVSVCAHKTGGGNAAMPRRAHRQRAVDEHSHTHTRASTI